MSKDRRMAEDRTTDRPKQDGHPAEEGEKVPRRKRVLPKQPIPSANPIGTAIAVLGVFLLLVCVFSAFPAQTGMPGVCGLIAGAVLGLGFAILHGSFTLRFFLILVLICGASATLTELSARFTWYSAEGNSYRKVFEVEDNAR